MVSRARAPLPLHPLLLRSRRARGDGERVSFMSRTHSSPLIEVVLEEWRDDEAGIGLFDEVPPARLRHPGSGFRGRVTLASLVRLRSAPNAARLRSRGIHAARPAVALKGSRDSGSALPVRSRQADSPRGSKLEDPASRLGLP